MAEFWPKFAEKEPKKFVERISFFYSYDKHSVTTTKFKYNFVDPSAERCFFLCENWPNFFQNWLNFSCTGRKIISGAGNSTRDPCSVPLWASPQKRHVNSILTSDLHIKCSGDSTEIKSQLSNLVCLVIP